MDVHTLLEAAEHNDLATVKACLEANVPVDAANPNGHTALMKASVGWMPMMQYLLEQGADVNAQVNGNSYTPLMMAASFAPVEAVQLLLDWGADVNAVHHRTGLTALLMAATNNQATTVEVLLERGATLTFPGTAWQL